MLIHLFESVTLYFSNPLTTNILYRLLAKLFYGNQGQDGKWKTY